MLGNFLLLERLKVDEKKWQKNKCLSMVITIDWLSLIGFFLALSSFLSEESLTTARLGRLTFSNMS